MKIYTLLAAVVFLSGCSKVPDYIDNKILHDEHGCAFSAHKNVGDTLFLRFSSKDSKQSCEYVKYVGGE